jgi:hypothetical protein
VANWIKFNLSGADKLQADLQNKTSELQQALSTRVNALLVQLQTKLVAKIGQGLKRRTGALVGSVRTWAATIEGDAIKGSVGVPEGPTHGYAMVHELGHEGAYRITATRAKALAWQMSVKRNARMAFARYVDHPPIPALHYTSTTAEEIRENVIRQLQETANEVLKKR